MFNFSAHIQTAFCVVKPHRTGRAGNFHFVTVKWCSVVRNNPEGLVFLRFIVR